VWEAATLRGLSSQAASKNRIETLAFSPDGKVLATAARSGAAREPAEIRLWDVTAATLQERAPLRGHVGAVRALALAPEGRACGADGRTLATVGGVAGVAGEVVLWDAIGGQPLAALHGHKELVDGLAFSPDGATLLTAGGRDAGAEVKLWDLAQFRPPLLLEHAGAVRCAALSPDGRLLATGGQDRAIRLWDMATGKQIRLLSGHTADVLALAFAPDGQVLASGGEDRSVKVWSVAEGREVAALVGQAQAVAGLAFAPDGRTLAVSAGEVGLWDWGSGRQRLSLAGATADVRGV